MKDDIAQAVLAAIVRRILAAVLITILLAAIVGFMAGRAFAHDAIPTASQPLGWQYPVNCCSSLDCGMISYKVIKETPEGYMVSLKKSDHIMLIKDTAFFIQYNDPRVKPSPDGEYHICISKQHSAPTGDMLGGNVICFFVPPKGS